MGKKGGSSPKAPAPIDPGKAMGEYMFGKDFTSYQGITDPRLQERTLAAEATYRPQYSALELADINTMWAGTEDGAANPAYTRLSGIPHSRSIQHRASRPWFRAGEESHWSRAQ
jgi:hypothetical protein